MGPQDRVACLSSRRAETCNPLWDATPLRRILARLLAPRETFRDLDIPLVVVAADLSDLRTVGRHPFLLRAVPRGGEEYRVIVDGGVCDNMPSEPAGSSFSF